MGSLNLILKLDNNVINSLRRFLLFKFYYLSINKYNGISRHALITYAGNMDKPKHTEPTLERILSVLKPMGELIVQDEAGAQGIHKDNILFCLVNENDVYLNNVEVCGPYYFHKGLRLPFRKVENIHTILELKARSHDIDKFLKYAIQSYWLMAGFKKNKTGVLKKKL